MSYHNSSISVSEDGQSAVQTFHGAEDKVVEPELVEPDDEKPLKSQTVVELRDIAQDLGMKSGIVHDMNKADLVEAIERATSSSD